LNSIFFQRITCSNPILSLDPFGVAEVYTWY
jgi:hypothetical protein